MINAVIPGHRTLNLEVMVLDFNGTLGVDGQMFDTVKEALIRLAPQLEIHVLTSDTYGTVARQCEGLPAQVKVLESKQHAQEKAAYIKQFGNREVVAIGNGANDELMLEQARLGIAVIGPEGASGRTLLAADVVVNRIEDGFGLLFETKRLIATLRR